MASSMRTTKTARAKVYNCLNGDALGVRICALVRANMQCAMRHGNNLVNDKVNSGNEPRSKYLFRPMRKLYVLVVPQMQYTWRKKAPFQENVARASTTSPPLANVASLAGSPRELRTDMNVKPNCSSFHMMICTEEPAMYITAPQPTKVCEVVVSHHDNKEPARKPRPPKMSNTAPHQPMSKLGDTFRCCAYFRTPPSTRDAVPAKKDQRHASSKAAAGNDADKMTPKAMAMLPEK
mmetsp:Transcript_54182/g.107034  ORF Transcript_54182/g.107034 Transcript_54182/m.107034 type:complete len:236 (+) Transcript_54182:156-863(+)